MNQLRQCHYDKEQAPFAGLFTSFGWYVDHEFPHVYTEFPTAKLSESELRITFISRMQEAGKIDPN